MMLTLALLLLQADWSSWRGPFENGMARGEAPTTWSSETENVAWKTEIPGRGHSSPVLYGDLLFVTTAVPEGPLSAPGGGRGPGGGFAANVPHRFLVLCLNRKTGKVVWEREALRATPHEGYHFRYGSFASNSPVTDGKHVYAFFGSRGLFVYTMDGKPAWQKSFSPMRMRLAFGEGTAPVLHDNTLLLGFDQEEGSYLLALDKTTGKQLWKVDRDEPSAWAPPLVLTHEGQKQIIVAATNKTRSYEFATGKLIWECAGLGTNVIPAPVTAKGLVYVMSGHRDPNLMAIRLGRKGDLTGTDAVVWQNKRANSYTPSPVLINDRLYFVSDNGFFSCLNALTGEVLFQERLPKPYNFKASPVGVNGKLYLSTEEGDVLVMKMADKMELLATNT
ncbi:MAG: PQQ-binding-like beta-propeller repeat protein, partial [Acidobacteriota bacterium]